MLPAEFHADYSFYEKFNLSDESGEKATSLKLLLKDVQFSANVQPGLELVDILSNAVRRALTNSLQKEGWQNIHRLMIHENDGPYISFVAYHEGGDIVHVPTYSNVIDDGFRNDGKLMLTKRNLKLALSSKTSRPVIAV